MSTKIPAENADKTMRSGRGEPPSGRPSSEGSLLSSPEPLNPDVLAQHMPTSFQPTERPPNLFALENAGPTPLGPWNGPSRMFTGGRPIRLVLYGRISAEDAHSIWIDHKSTYGDIVKELATIDATCTFTVLEPIWGPTPRWAEANPKSLIGNTSHILYAVVNDDRRYIVGMVRASLSDYPVAIFESPVDPSRTVIQAIIASRPELKDQIKSITGLLEGQSGKHTDLLMDQNFKSVVIINASDDPPKPLMTKLPTGSVPPLLRVPFAHCENLMKQAYDLEFFALQIIHILRAILHIIISLAKKTEAVFQDDPSDVETALLAEGEVSEWLRATPMLARNLQEILDRVEELMDNVTTEDQSTMQREIKSLFEAVCDDYPGAVDVRHSHRLFTKLGLIDREEDGVPIHGSGVSGTEMTQPRGVLSDDEPSPKLIPSPPPPPSLNSYQPLQQNPPSTLETSAYRTPSKRPTGYSSMSTIPQPHLPMPGSSGSPHAMQPNINTREEAGFGIDQYQCTHCGLNFDHPGRFEAHLNAHSDFEPQTYSTQYSQPQRSHPLSDSGRSEVSDYTRPSFGDVPYIRPAGHRIREYPTNILQRVFTYWHGLYTKDLLSAVKSGHAYEENGMEAPFRLAEICQEFRVAVENSPNLWSLVHVNFASTNESLIHRLRNLLYWSRGEPLTIIFQGVNVRACSTAWYHQMLQILEPTKSRWVTVAVSFTSPQDLQDCWSVWPLLGDNVSDLRIWGSVQGGASTIPMGFLQGSTALERLELRNVAWIHHPGRAPMLNVSRLCVGPSVDEVLGHWTVKELCASFPAISSLTLLAFETCTWTSHAIPLPASFQLTNLTHLTVSPVMLGTSLQGFQVRRVIPALMTVSVRFCSTPADEEWEEREEAEERSRRDQDLVDVGMFLKDHAIQTLKLQGLDIGYEPSAVQTLLFENMITKQLANLYLEECSGHTTQYMEMVLKRLTFREMSPVGRKARSVSRTREGRVYLLPGLQSLYVFKCDDLDVAELPNWVRGAPKGLKEVVIRGSKVDIDEDKYSEAKHVIKHKRK